MKNRFCFTVMLSVGACSALAAEPSKVVLSPMRVQSQWHITLPTSANSPTEEMKAMESARDQLYAIAGRECGTLQQTFGAECRLTGLSIDSGVTNRAGDHAISITLQNSYELKPKP